MLKEAKHLLIISIALLSFGLVTSQADNGLLDSIIKLHKNFNIDELSSSVAHLGPLKLKQLISYDIEYLKDGVIVEASKLRIDDLKGRDEYVGRYILADLLKREGSEPDSLVLKYYLESFEDAKLNTDTLVINEIVNRLNTWYFLNGNELKSYKKGIKLFKRFRKDSVDYFNCGFHEIGLMLLDFENNPKDINRNKMESKFREISNYAINPYLKGLLYNLQTVYYSGYIDNQRLARMFTAKAINEFNTYQYHFAKYATSGLEFNNAIILYEEGKFMEAIPVFKRALKTETQLVYRMHGYDWLHKCYDSIGDYGNAYRYFKKVGEVKDSLNLLEHAREIKSIEAKYDFAKKEHELENLANEKNRVQTNFNTLVPFFGIALILVVVALYLYNKYRRRSELLQEEKAETLKRIDQLKKIVIKNHIILKDKTKVYIADLIYIKAEDHYLKLFLSNRKDHLVRGKIKDIKRQLPPNFIRCHRSYIVNANFIKQANRDNLIMIGGHSIPLSRTYKDNF